MFLCYYVTRSTMSGDILLFLCFFVIIIILPPFFVRQVFWSKMEPMLMELYYNEDPHLKLCTLLWNGKKWPPFPWKQHKCEKNQSVPNWKKLHRNVDWHVLISSLTLEFSKWLPLPWKQLKYQKF